MLEGCLDEKSPQPNALELLAGLKFKDKKYDEAAKWYALGQRLDPFDVRWTRGLAKVHTAAGNKPAARKSLARLAQADVDDLATRKQLVEMALDQKDYAAAEAWGREAIEIDVQDADMHRAVAESLAARDDAAGAAAEYEVVIELKPDDPRPRLALAAALSKPANRRKPARRSKVC